MAFEGYDKRVKQELNLTDALNHLLGRYMMSAFNKPKSYPTEPFLANQNKKEMSTDIEGALRKVAQAIGAKNGSNHNRRTQGTDNRPERPV